MHDKAKVFIPEVLGPEEPDAASQHQEKGLTTQIAGSFPALADQLNDALIKASVRYENAQTKLIETIEEIATMTETAVKVAERIRDEKRELLKEHLPGK